MPWQRQAILRCKKCEHEWQIDYVTGNQYPCPVCEGDNPQS